MKSEAARRKSTVTRSEVAFLCKTLDDIFTSLQSSSSYFYGEKEDRKVLEKISTIKTKNKLNSPLHPPTH